MLSSFNLEEFDSLLLPGAMNIRDIIEDSSILEFIKSFHEQDKIIGAISIAPILLLKAGVLKNKRFMAGVNQEDLLQEGFSNKDLEMMIGWDDNLDAPIEDGYIEDNNIITSVSYNFIKWAMAFGRAIGIDVYPKSFGLEK